jgi:hypothetical protein
MGSGAGESKNLMQEIRRPMMFSVVFDKYMVDRLELQPLALTVKNHWGHLRPKLKISFKRRER